MNRVFIGIILIALTFCKEDRISNFRLCGDPKCSEPVSFAKTLIRYTSDDKRILSFEHGVDVVIYSKSAGSRLDLWGAEIKGKRGYVPKGLVREQKIIKKILNFTVPTEFNIAAKSNEDKSGTKSTEDKDNDTQSSEDEVNATKSSEGKEITAKSVEGEILIQSTHETKNGTERVSSNGNLSASQTQTSSSTPRLTNQVLSAGSNLGSFSFKGVSADSSENRAPSPDSVVKPYEVIDGTTLFLSTDGDVEDGSPSVVKATAVPRVSTPSATVDPEIVKSEVNQYSGPEEAKHTSDPKTDEKAEENAKLPSRKSEVENLIDGKGTGSQNNVGNVKRSVEQSEDVYVSDDDGDDTDDEDDDDEEDDDGDDESGEDHSENNEENEMGEDHDASKVVDDNGNSENSLVSKGVEESLSMKGEAPVDGSGTEINLNFVGTSQNDLNTPDISELQSSDGSSDVNVKKETDSKVELDLNDISSSAHDNHSTNHEIKAGISEGINPLSSSENIPDSAPVSGSGDEMKSVDENIKLPELSSTDQDSSIPKELRDVNETEYSEEVFLSGSSVLGETLQDTVTEMPVGKSEAVPPVGNGEPTEKLLSEENMSTERYSDENERVSPNGEVYPPVEGEVSPPVEGEVSPLVEVSPPGEDVSSAGGEGSSSDGEISPIEEGSSTGNEELSSDVKGSSDSDDKGSSDSDDKALPDRKKPSQDIERLRDIENSFSDVEQLSNVVEVPPVVLDEIETNESVLTNNIITSDIIEEGTTTTVHDHHESENGNDTDEIGVSIVENSQENNDLSNEILNDPVDEEESLEAQSAMLTQHDSSESLLSGMTGTLRHGYEIVAGLFWSVTPEEPVTTEGGATTTSTPTEGPAIDIEKEENDIDSVAVNKSLENAEDNSGEANEPNVPLKSMLEKSNTKDVPFQNTAETVSQIIDACRKDSGLDGPCSEAESMSPVFDPRSNSRKLQQDMEYEHEINFENDFLSVSSNSIWFVISTGILVTIFTLGFIYLEKRKFHSSLVAEVNALKKELQIKSIEMMSKSDEGVLEQRDSEELHASVASLQQQLQDSQERCSELEEKVLALEKELETATETGLELNRMLGDMLSSQQDSDQLAHNMEDLRRQLDSQEAAMKADLAAKTAENEKLQAQLDKVLEKNCQLDGEIEKLKEKLEKTTNQQQELQKLNELLQVQLSEERRQAAGLAQALAVRDSEVTVLQDCLKQAGEGGEEEGGGVDKFQALLDEGRVRAELRMVSLERDALADRLRGEEGSRKLLEDHVELITKEVAKLRSRYEEAEKEKTEAQTRLEVLSNYFKEKETQLQKELGLQEAMNIQKDGDVTTTSERIRLLQEEVENYKSQVDTMKKEILDQERGLKSQISVLEKKAHENWVAARQAERRLEETKQEAGQLRNRLTIVEKNITNTGTPNGDTSLKMAERLPSESNGELPMSPPLIDSPLHYREGLPVSPPLLPPFMLPPPGVPFMPPPNFMPPPPPPMFPGDRRPPPLGRMSSPPPPGGDYSPSFDGRSDDRSPPPYHVESLDRYRRRTPPRWDQPVGPRSGFRPLPPNLRTTPREPKGSAVSSGHSSESSRHSDNNMV
ncbi:transport and Golgi organization protein 1 [Bacillus rossius redtenbacheri]|uniref:transport and Golgi organization protein 1 n=1 Tax=Bacillus rossius redtenbacheri TaxID=93214 RepID=UPI002FDCE5CA